MDVLFLSVSIGGGHLKAAEAVKERIEQRFPHSKTLIVDTLKYVNPIVDKVIVGSYLNTVKKTPQIYRKLYEMSESGENIYELSRVINKLMSFRIKNLIDEFMPSVIVCTHPFPLQMLSALKRNNKVNVPVVAILTDYVTHSFWVYDNIDAYVVAHKNMKYEMIKKGVSEDIIYPFGIPVSQSFLQSKERKTLLDEFCLDDKLTVLAMGGSLGFGKIGDIFHSLINCKKDIQLIVVTGKNIKLKNQLEKYSTDSGKRVKILSYTNRIADLMEVSDIIITKPGGMTITESLVKGLPMLIVSPIPGQEERNARFLTDRGAGIRIYNNKDMDHVLHQVVDSPVKLGKMGKVARALSRPDASENIVDMMETLISKAFAVV